MQVATKHVATPANGTGEALAPLGRRDPRYQPYAGLRLAFTVAPIAFGIDRFLAVLVNWPVYLAP